VPFQADSVLMGIMVPYTLNAVAPSIYICHG